MSALPHAQHAAAPVNAALNFIKPQAAKPSFHSSALTGGAPKYFYELEPRTVQIADMRSLPSAPSLDREGFELHAHKSAVSDLYDDEAIHSQYYAEIEDLLKERFAANDVVIFDATRRSDGGQGAKNPDGKRGPASQLHVDYTTNSGPQRLADVVGDDEADRLLESGARVIQVNVWRPIKGPVQRSPLALADASSTGERDLVATDQVFPDRIGEIYNIAHSPAQRWYYAPHMTPDEVLLIKGWDSLDDGRARFTPHGAFEAPGTTAQTPPRESIEVRTFVIIE
ncbi:MAG: CmcJ/NvfI family oxidoreductase [Pseudomonadota bacterium]